MELVTLFGGECLTDKRLSVVKGVEAYKFKCAQGHVFYMNITEMMKPMSPTTRKLSKSTNASSSCSSSDSFSPLPSSPDNLVGGGQSAPEF